MRSKVCLDLRREHDPPIKHMVQLFSNNPKTCDLGYQGYSLDYHHVRRYQKHVFYSLSGLDPSLSKCTILLGRLLFFSEDNNNIVSRLHHVREVL